MVNIELYKSCIKVAACICAKDGVISELEESELYKCSMQEFPEIDKGIFESALDEFFEADDQIEKYLSLIDDENLRRITLTLSQKSASADGLDARENIALAKACLIWGIEL